MKFGIIGAGAMGCRLAYQLYKSGEDVLLVDTWQEHVDRIKEKGLRVHYNGKEDIAKLPIFYPSEKIDTVDIVILLTKAMQLDGMLQAVQAIFHEETKVICLLNGLGHEKIIEKYVKKENIFMGTTIWTAQLKGPGYAFLQGVGGLSLQNIVAVKTAQDVAQDVVNRFNKANLNADYSQDVTTAIWRKAAVNCCCNATTALLESNLEQFINQQTAQDIVFLLTKEIVAVAKTQNVYLDEHELSAFIIAAAKRVGEHFASMYQDLVSNHRLTEVDYLNGYIVQLGKEHGIPVFYNDLVTKLIHIKEVILQAK